MHIQEYARMAAAISPVAGRNVISKLLSGRVDSAHAPGRRKVAPAWPMPRQIAINYATLRSIGQNFMSKDYSGLCRLCEGLSMP